MDFWDLTKLVFRRWYIALPCILLTLAATVWTGLTVQPDYKATAYVQLIPPNAASTTTNITELGNPWLNLGLGALNTAATYSTVDRTFLNELKTKGLSDNVVITTGYPAPIATIEVVAGSKEQAIGTAEAVVLRFGQVVQGLQDSYGVRTVAMIVTRRLDTGQNLEQTGGKVKRALVAVAGVGMLFTIGLTIGFDAAARRRGRRKAEAAEARSGRGSISGSTSGSTSVAASAAMGDVRAGSRLVRYEPAQDTEQIEVTNGGAGVAASRQLATVPAQGGEGQAEPDPRLLDVDPTEMTVILPKSVFDQTVSGAGPNGGVKRRRR